MSIASTRRRLMEKKLKVGDQVTIRQWDDMLKEYGYQGQTDVINVPFAFTPSMEKYCGKKFEIFRVDRIDKVGYYHNRYKLKELNTGKSIELDFGKEMFELIPGDGYVSSLRGALAPDNKFTVDLI